MASIMCESTDSRQSDLDAMRPRRESSSPIGEDGIAAAPGGQDAENAAVIAFRGQQVFCGSQAIALSATEYRLLELLASRPGEVLSRRQILDELHGAQYAITERAIDTQLVGVRRKLGQWAHCIETVRGRGYRFRPLELPATFADDSDAGASPLE